jgi:hypothetical protein
MTTFGLIFMLLYWAGLTGLLIFCLTKTLKKPETE